MPYHIYPLLFSQSGLGTSGQLHSPGRVEVSPKCRCIEYVPVVFDAVGSDPNVCPGTIAIAYGFIADIAPPAERGSYVGVLQGL